MTNWSKYTFVCDPDECDTMIEVTVGPFNWPNGVVKLTCPCGREMQYLSVQDATIPSTTTKEEKMEYPYNNPDETPQVIALQETILAKDRFIESLQSRSSMDSQRINLYTNSVNALKEYLLENYNELEMHADSIADIFDISLKREVTVTFTIHASATVDVEPGMDVEDIITDNVFVDANYGDIVIDDYTVEDVEVS